MSESETEDTRETPTGEQASKRTDENVACRRCNRKQGLVGKYDINLCRQCFREVARPMGFQKYR
jgi:small subunit ribosomal protein S14